ncbi:MAG: S8 family serine peptidase [Acidobacteria bacterium]|nr:S8 family serine peptidase [Acidobacteriota bacterium]
MRDSRTVRGVSFCAPVLILLALSSPAAGPPAQGGVPPAGTGWERKLDPFLRRLARGTVKTEGRFKETVPGRSEEAARSLPRFLQIEKAAAPVAHVKIGLAGAAPAAGRTWASLERDLPGLGAQVKGRFGAVASLRVPAAALEALARRPEIAWLKAAHGYSLLNEVSTTSAHLGSDEANSALTRGAGAIVAVVDTGIQWTDHDFRNADGTSRILGIWDQTLSDPAHPPPAGFSFGAYYAQSDIDAALATSGTLLTGDGHGHGTHVAGTAAGNGLETGNGIAAGTFAGVAPEADLLIVRVFDDGGNFCDACDLTAAVQFISQTAAAAGRPWVGNMSLGTDIGAHDGTDPDERAIDAAVGPGRRGAQMAIAAGNSGGRDRTPRAFHWEGTLPAAGASVTNNFNPSYTPNGGGDNDFIWLDLWYEGDDRATVSVVTPTGITVSAAHGADSGIVCTADGAVQVDATNAPDPVNGDNEVFIQLWDSSTCNPVVPPRTGTWTIRVTTDAIASPSPTFDLWNEASAGLLSFVSLTVSNLGKSVGVPGTSKHAITAGSYAGKNSWINVIGQQIVASLSTFSGVGSLSGFSSLGPTRDGRIKPDVAAPGEWVGSSLAGSIQATRGNNFTERDGEHGDIRGTSMATPHVAGTAALLLAINPDLEGPEVKAAITASARSDSFAISPGPLPNTYYGHGKLRALEAGYIAASIVSDFAATSTGFTGTDGLFVDGYNVYRGTIPGLSATAYGSCFLQGLPAPDFSDPENPPDGQAFSYLVTGVHAGLEGILGTDSEGRIRPNNSPCL